MLGGNLGKISKLGRLFTGGLNCDPYFGNVALLLHFDGANGSTTYTDNSSSPKTVTSSGGAQLRTAVFKYGTASGFFNGSTSYITATLNTQLSSTNFTIEGWFYPNAVSSSIQCLFSTLNSSVSNGLEIGYNNASLYYQVKNGPTSAAVSGNVVATITTGTWYHYALVKNGTSYVIYLNGVGGTPSTFAGTWADTANATIGAIVASTTFYYLNGYVDDYRVTPGIARYTSNFTPPMAAFPNNDCNFTSFIDLTDNIYPTVPIPSSFNFTTLNIPGLNVAPIPSSFNFTTLNIPGLNVAPIPSSFNFTTLNIPNYPVTSTTTDINKFFTDVITTTALELGAADILYTTNVSNTVLELGAADILYTTNISNTELELGTGGLMYSSSESIVGVTLSSDSVSESSTDPDFLNVTLLLHLDETSGSTSTTDSCTAPKTVTFNGSSQIINNRTRDTTNNLYLTTNGYLSIPPGGGVGLITTIGNFCFEMWFNSSSASQGTLFFIEGNTTPTSTLYNRLHVYIGANSTVNFYTESAVRITSSNNIFSINTWNHVALTRELGVYRLFVNGNLINSYTRTLSGSSTSNNLQIGGFLGGASTDFFNGWMDEIRVTNTLSRYTSSFKPRLRPFPNSA